MNRQKIIAISCSLVGAAIVLVLALLLRQPSEPVYQDRALSAWLKDLSSRDTETRALAEEILGEAGPDTVPFLLHGLDHVKLPWRKELLRLLQYTPWRIDPNEQSKQIEAAMLAVYYMGTNAAPGVPVFVDWLAVEPYFGAFCLSRVGSACGDDPSIHRAVPLLIDHLGASDPDMRDIVVGSLRNIGHIAVPALTGSLTNSNATIRERATSLIVDSADAGTAATLLLGMLGDQQASVRRVAAGGLGKFGDQAKVAGPKLIEVLEDPDPFVRLAAAKSLFQLRTNEDIALTAVFDALNSTETEVRVSGVVVLGLCTNLSDRVIRRLISKLEASYAEVADAELKAQHDATAQKTLGHLKWQEGYFRVNALTSVGKLLPQSRHLHSEIIPVLLMGLSEEQGWVPKVAADVLGDFGRTAQDAVPGLLQLLMNGSDSAERAALALTRIAPENIQAVEALLTALESSSVSLRAAAATALGSHKGTDLPVAGLLEALADPRHEVRRAAANSLGHIPSDAKEVREALNKSSIDPFPSVRGASRRALAAMAAPTH